MWLMTDFVGEGHKRAQTYRQMTNTPILAATSLARVYRHTTALLDWRHHLSPSIDNEQQNTTALAIRVSLVWQHLLSLGTGNEHTNDSTSYQVRLVWQQQQQQQQQWSTVRSHNTQNGTLCAVKSLRAVNHLRLREQATNKQTTALAI